VQQLTFVRRGRLEWREVPDPKLEGPVEALVRPLAVARCDLDIGLPFVVTNRGRCCIQSIKQVR